MGEKLLFTLFFTVHMPWCTVHGVLGSVWIQLILLKTENTIAK